MRSSRPELEVSTWCWQTSNLRTAAASSFCSVLRKSCPCPAVIMLSACAEADEAEAAVKGGAWDYIQYPAEQDTVTLSLTRALQYQQEKRNLGLPMALKRDRIVGNSAATRDSLDLVAQAAGCQANVLISGETGSGKELYAAAIHENSSRRRGELRGGRLLGASAQHRRERAVWPREGRLHRGRPGARWTRCPGEPGNALPR
jgi:hypothetical protein